jgi:hypothetical protein
MVCYRCGTGFQWQEAQVVATKKKTVSKKGHKAKK